MSVKLRWLGGPYEIVFPSGKVLLTSSSGFAPPITYEDLTRVDYVVVHHDSWPATGGLAKLVEKFNSTVICSHYVGNRLTTEAENSNLPYRPFAELFYPIDESNVVKVTAGNCITFDDFKLEVMKAEHPTRRPAYSNKLAYKIATGKEAPPGITLAEIEKARPHPALTREVKESWEKLRAVGLGFERGEHLNFVVQTSDNLRIYLSSSSTTGFMRHEIAAAHCNILIGVLGGGLGEGEPEEIAEYAALSSAEVVICPGSRIFGPEVQMEERRQIAKHFAARSKAHFACDIVPGKWYELGVKISNI